MVVRYMLWPYIFFCHKLDFIKKAERIELVFDKDAYLHCVEMQNTSVGYKSLAQLGNIIQLHTCTNTDVHKPTAGLR